MYSLDQGERSYLTSVAWSSDVIAFAESQVRIARRKRYRFLIIIAVVYAIFLGWYFYQIFVVAPQITYPTTKQVILLLLLVITYTASAVALPFLILRSSGMYRTFQATVDCLPRIENALGTPQASRERRELASSLGKCARVMRSYRSSVPLTAQARIKNKQVAQGSRVFKQLMYPPMLGTDDDLR